MKTELLAFLNLGGPEMAIIFLIVLLLFGAKKLPQLARGVGKSIGEFQKARDEFEGEIKRAGNEASSSEAKEKKPEEV